MAYHFNIFRNHGSVGFIVISALFVLLGNGCGGKDSKKKDTHNDPKEHKPNIIFFGTNVTEITEGEPVVFSAVVTDPDGIDNLIGGVLNSPEGASYGSFATSAQEGSYSLSITWGQIDQVVPIEFSGTTQRTFIAVFFDATGNSVEANTTITLTCNTENACEGTCVDLQSNSQHCGSCRNSCDDMGGSCESGACSCTDLATLCGGVCFYDSNVECLDVPEGGDFIKVCGRSNMSQCDVIYGFELQKPTEVYLAANYMSVGCTDNAGIAFILSIVTNELVTIAESHPTGNECPSININLDPGYYHLRVFCKAYGVNSRYIVSVLFGQPRPIDWCRLQWPLDLTIPLFTDTDVYGRVFHAGITDRTTGVDASASLIGQLGYGPSSSSPMNNGQWTWILAAGNSNWDGNSAGEPNNDEYQKNLFFTSTGTFDFAYRFSSDNGLTWTYCDREPGSSDGYSPEQAGHLTVQ